ncbi:putative bifunctional diguanylate cyclase/phosphodiesterase [Thiolapillus sp.]
MHRLLKRQLRKLGLDGEAPTPEEWQHFLAMVDDAYSQADQDRYTLERSLTISSEEMQSLYQQLKASSEARMSAIATAFPDILFFQDEDGRFLDVLTSRPEDLYVPREEIIGQRMEDIFDEDRVRPFLRLLRDTLETNELQQIEYQMPNGRGETRLFEARMVPMDFREKGKRTLLTVVRDITDARREETWGRLVSKAVTAAREGIVILDAERRIISANPAVEGICQVALMDVLGKDVSALCDPGGELLGEDAWLTLETVGGWHGEAQICRPDGSPVSLWLNVDRVQPEPDGPLHYVILLNDISELHASRRELEKLATHDPLTGLPNRILFQDRLEQALARATRTGRSGALFFMDLDRFKIINDSLGHQVGDRLLQAVANRMSAHIRQGDTLARMGGDEFTLIVEDLKRPEDVVHLLEKLQQEFRRPFTIDQHELRTTASIGVSIFPRDGSTTDELIKHADTAMYSAKDGGRDQYRFFTEKLTLSAYSYFDTEQGLHKALARNEFYLLYQPQYEVATGKLVGVEALLRWNRPGQGMINPLKFIAMAEMTGLIEPLGAWVRETVCRQIQAWQEAGAMPPRVAVNLSSRELTRPGLNASVASLLSTYRIPAELLEFEITESVIIERGDVAYQNLFGLTEMGIELAIDDFGTGHSSLLNLKRFPLASLKIDRSFVRDLLVDANDEAIVRATIVLARSFGMKTVAEGVENRQQLEFLREAGCDVVQGYLCGKPMSHQGISRLLASADLHCDD